MRINPLQAMIETAAWGAAVLLLGAGAGCAQQQINLSASGTGLILPDGTWTPMWGYFCGTPVSGSTATCAAANAKAPSNSWSPVIITVPIGQDLRINLTNNLSFLPYGSTTPNNIPTSLMIVGQVGGGLGSGATYSPSPQHVNQPETWSTTDAAGGVFTPPAQGPRVQSFGTEVAVGQTTNNALIWKAPRPGTYFSSRAHTLDSRNDGSYRNGCRDFELRPRVLKGSLIQRDI